MSLLIEKALVRIEEAISGSDEIAVSEKIHDLQFTVRDNVKYLRESVDSVSFQLSRIADVLENLEVSGFKTYQCGEV